MKLLNNIKWLWSNDIAKQLTDLSEDIEYEGTRITAMYADSIGKENIQAAESVFPDNGLWMFASVAELFKENRVETYTVKAIRLLNNAGIHSVAQLTTQTERDLRKIKGMGTNTIGYIQDSLARQGLALGGK